MAPKHTARSILNAFYEAETAYAQAPESEKDFSGIAAVIDPKAILYQTSGLPYAGLYHGRQGLQDWMQQMSLWFDRLEVRDPQVFEQQGSNQVMVSSTLYLRVSKTAEELIWPFAQTFTMDLDAGTITEIRPFYWDVHDLNRAIGFVPKETAASSAS